MHMLESHIPELRTIHPRIKAGKYQKSQACDFCEDVSLCVCVRLCHETYPCKHDFWKYIIDMMDLGDLEKSKIPEKVQQLADMYVIPQDHKA